MTYAQLDEHDAEIPADEARKTEPSLSARIGSGLLTFVLGVVYGTVGTVAHPLSVVVLGVPVPYGLVLALIGALALLLGLRLVLEERTAVFTSALGLVGTVVLFSFKSAGGSVLIAQGLVGMIWLFAVPLIAALVLAWPRMPQQSSSTVAA